MRKGGIVKDLRNLTLCVVVIAVVIIMIVILMPKKANYTKLWEQSNINVTTLEDYGKRINDLEMIFEYLGIQVE